MALQATDESSAIVQPRYGSVADLAIYSGLSPKSVRNLLDAGKLKSHKVGRRVLIAFSDFDQYMETTAR